VPHKDTAWFDSEDEVCCNGLVDVMTCGHCIVVWLWCFALEREEVWLCHDPVPAHLFLPSPVPSPLESGPHATSETRDSRLFFFSF
jgi:hypothetical protein